jgi:hypothetical protein
MLLFFGAIVTDIVIVIVMAPRSFNIFFMITIFNSILQHILFILINYKLFKRR